MTYRFLADLVVVIHLGFIFFAIVGGLFAFRWKAAIWFHAPAVVWSTLILVFGWACPLTPLENWLRQKGGEGGYETSFIDQYIIPLIYPGVLSSKTAIALATALLVVNLLIYGWIYRQGGNSKLKVPWI
jgi:hypothetical protein